MPETTARCRFYVKTATDGGWYYDPISIASPESDGALHTSHPPVVGDLIWLWDSLIKAGGTYRVVDRFWMHAGHGSVAWRYGNALPSQGPELQMIVESADGLFVRQVLRPEDEDGDQGETTDATT